MVAETRCVFFCDKSTSQFVDVVKTACIGAELKIVTLSDKDREGVAQAFNTFLGQTSILQNAYAFLTRYKRIVFGRKDPTTFVVLMEAKDDPEKNRVVGEHLRQLARGKPVFFILLVSRERNIIAPMPWDIELLLSPIPDPQRASAQHALSVRNILTTLARARSISMTGIREGIFWRWVDILLFAVLVPLLIGLTSGFGEGLGQNIFNALAAPGR